MSGTTRDRVKHDGPTHTRGPSEENPARSFLQLVRGQREMAAKDNRQAVPRALNNGRMKDGHPYSHSWELGAADKHDG
jgi:hypothetical protein